MNGILSNNVHAHRRAARAASIHIAHGGRGKDREKDKQREREKERERSYVQTSRRAAPPSCSRTYQLILMTKFKTSRRCDRTRLGPVSSKSKLLASRERERGRAGDAGKLVFGVLGPRQVDSRNSPRAVPCKIARRPRRKEKNTTARSVAPVPTRAESRGNFRDFREVANQSVRLTRAARDELPETLSLFFLSSFFWVAIVFISYFPFPLFFLRRTSDERRERL